MIWYIVDGKTPGIIVLLFLFTFFEFYFVLKYPKFIVIALLSMVTQVLIVGYELQVRKVGEQVGADVRMNQQTIKLSCIRLRPATGNRHIQSTSLHPTDWHVLPAVCWLLFSGHSSLIHLLPGRSFGKILEHRCICSPTSILSFIQRLGCASTALEETLAIRIALATSSTKLVRRCSRKNSHFWLDFDSTLHLPHGSLRVGANFLGNNMTL